MKFALVQILIFSLVFCGLWGFALAQIRTFQILKNLKNNDPILLKLGLTIAVGFYIVFWAKTYFHIVFRCFTGERCHATQNSELIYLALFGCYVVFFKIVFWLLYKIYKKCLHLSSKYMVYLL